MQAKLLVGGGGELGGVTFCLWEGRVIWGFSLAHRKLIFPSRNAQTPVWFSCGCRFGALRRRLKPTNALQLRAAHRSRVRHRLIRDRRVTDIDVTIWQRVVFDRHLARATLTTHCLVVKSVCLSHGSTLCSVLQWQARSDIWAFTNMTSHSTLPTRRNTTSPSSSRDRRLQLAHQSWSLAVLCLTICKGFQLSTSPVVVLISGI